MRVVSLNQVNLWYLRVPWLHETLEDRRQFDWQCFEMRWPVNVGIPERRCDLLGAAVAATSRPFILTGSCANGRIMSDWLAEGGCYVTRSGRGRAVFAAARRASALGAEYQRGLFVPVKGAFFLFIS